MALALGTIEEGLDFILSHFDEPIWPRTIFTKTLGKQYTIYSREEAIARFKQSNLLDCRINAYLDYIEFKGINRQSPNFIFIDIDRCLFGTDKEFWSAVQDTSNNIELDLQPSSYPIISLTLTITLHSNHVCLGFQVRTTLNI